MSELSLPADRQRLVRARFNDKLRVELRRHVTEDLIEEHRRQPLGQHSDGLERLLVFLHQAPRYALYSRRACREYQIVRLPVTPGARPEPLDDTVYTDKNAALHAVFLRHLEDFMRD
jgi:branched-chain amino acid transport system permease protein